MGHHDFVHAVGHPRTKEIYTPILDICLLRPAMTYLRKIPICLDCLMDLVVLEIAKNKLSKHSTNEEGLKRYYLYIMFNQSHCMVVESAISARVIGES